MSNVEEGTWWCGVCSNSTNPEWSKQCMRCNGPRLIKPPPLPAPPVAATQPAAAASATSSATSSKKQPKLKPSTATSSSKKPRTDTSNNNSSFYVNDVEDDDAAEYIPDIIAVDDDEFYSSFSHYTMMTGTFASICGDTIPDEIAAWMATNNFQQECSLDDGALLDLRSSGIPSTAATANSGLKSDNPCVALQSELCKLTIKTYEPLKDLPLCKHTDPVTGVRCTFVATTLKVVDDDMTTARTGAHPNNRCDLHMEAGPQVEKNCIRSCGRKAWRQRSVLCVVCELAKRCKNGCDATIGKAGRTLCDECHGGTACTSCGGPRGLTGGSMCSACRSLQMCVECEANPVVGVNQNKCKVCHPLYHACKKCEEYKVVGCGNHYCADCKPLCKAKGCTAGAKVQLRNADRTPRTYKRYCGPKGKYCGLGH